MIEMLDSFRLLAVTVLVDPDHSRDTAAGDHIVGLFVLQRLSVTTI